jgi:hypothetical protein
MGVSVFADHGGAIGSGAPRYTPLTQAAALAGWVIIMSTRTAVVGSHLPLVEDHAPSRARERWVRLLHNVVELGEFIEKRHAVVREGNLSQ